MDLTIVGLIGILLLEHTSFITTLSSLPLKYQTCMSEQINGFHLYTGTQSYTKSGYQCERWDALNPVHLISSAILATNITHRTLQNNYCRTMYPDEHPVPWCYTTHVYTEREECDIKMCSFDIEADKYQSCMGEKIDGYYPYTGTEHVTKSGIQCQRWDSLKPQHHVRDIIIALGRTFLTSQHNYCRTMYPDGHAVPWCYTMDKEKSWEECNITKCNFDRLKEKSLDELDDGSVLISRRKPCCTSNTYKNKTYPNGIDDRNETKFKTLLSYYNKWEVDLVRMSKINYVILSHVKITKNIAHDFRKVDIHIGDEKHNDWEKCAYFDGPGKNMTKEQMFICEGIGQFVRVEIFHFGHFRLKDVGVFGIQYYDTVLLSENKRISLYDAAGSNGRYSTKTWEVDLLQYSKISYIVFSSVDSHKDLRKIAIYIGNKEKTFWDMCAFLEGSGESSQETNITKTQKISCEGIGTYIRVNIFHYGHFKFQNITVFGYSYDTNILLLYNSSASYVVAHGSDLFSYGTSYYYNTRFKTQLSYNFWKVNLSKKFKIRYVVLHNVYRDAQNASNILEIAIYLESNEQSNSTRCAYYNGPGHKSRKLYRMSCVGIGQIIRVKKSEFGRFDLQVIEVFGFVYDNDDALNLTRGKLTFSKSLSDNSAYGVDGAYSIIHTFFKWEVNLLRLHKISYVILYHDDDYLNIVVNYAGKEYNNWDTCPYISGPGKRSVNIYLACEGIAQYIHADISNLVDIFGYTIDDVILISFNKPTILKSLPETGNSEHGVDGDLNTNFKISVYLKGANYWSVNLLNSFKIRYVALYIGHIDNVYGSLQNISIHVTQIDNTVDYWCASLVGSIKRSKTLYRLICEGTGRYIIIIKHDNGHLVLQEVEVYGINYDAILLSLNKGTFISPNADEKQYDSRYGVDGRKDTQFKTRRHVHSQFLVDLSDMFKISHVTLTNVDTYESASDGFLHISIANKFHYLHRCAYFIGPGEKSVKYSFACEGIAESIDIEKFHFGHFQLQEVEVFGYYIGEVNLLSDNKPTFMSSTYEIYGPSNGINSNRYTKFKTYIADSNFFGIDLLNMCKITYVMFHINTHIGILDELRNISTYISETEKYNNQERCAYFNGPAVNQNFIVICEGIGRFVRIVKSYKGHLTMTGLDVYGKLL